MLTHYAGARRSSVSFRDRLDYILDQNSVTPGRRKECIRFTLASFLFIGFITREQAERVFYRLNRYNKSLSFFFNFAKDNRLVFFLCFLVG